VLLSNTESKEAGERGQAEHQGWLAAGEVRRGAHKIFDRPSAEILGKLVHSFGGATHKVSQLWSVLVEAVGSAVGGFGDVIGQIRLRQLPACSTDLWPFAAHRMKAKPPFPSRGPRPVAPLSDLRSRFACRTTQILRRVAGSRRRSVGTSRLR
jgi:hypothetical protein